MPIPANVVLEVLMQLFGKRSHVWILPFLLFAGLLSEEARAGPPAQTKPAEKDTSAYLVSENCKGCHRALYNAFEATPHWKTMLDTHRGPAFQGCEGCHGPGKEHAHSMGTVKVLDFKSVSAAKVVERCLECHHYTEEHANFRRSMHRRSNMSCIDCHSQHSAGEKQYLLRQPQPEVCYACHQDKKPDFAKPFHHRVNERLVKCTDCHNQHGGYLTKQLRSTAVQEAICGKCHVEKAGPFVFEHAPLKTEGCTACHVPHGSANPRLLKRSQVNLLCLECHTATAGSRIRATPGFHNQNLEFQACTLCHVAIHGSNFSAVFSK